MVKIAYTKPFINLAQPHQRSAICLSGRRRVQHLCAVAPSRPYFPRKHMEVLPSAGKGEEVNGVKKVLSFRLAKGKLSIAKGSVVEYTGTAIVNAANAGCLSGSGVDGAVNDRGGPELVEAREALPVLDDDLTRCPVGEAKTTVAGQLGCEWVIHAVGPQYNKEEDEDTADAKLYSAYASAMQEARSKGMPDVAFSLLSAGIFRGDRPLACVLRLGLLAAAANAYPELEEVFFVGFTQEEVKTLEQEATVLFYGSTVGAFCNDPVAYGTFDGIPGEKVQQLHMKAVRELLGDEVDSKDLTVEDVEEGEGSKED